MEETLKQWTNQKAGVEIKAVLVRDVPYEATEGSGTEISDLWLLFLSILSNDYWIGYGAVDDLSDEPQESLNRSNVTELKKVSIVIGDRWRDIEGQPLQASQRHRMMASDAKVVNDIIMEMGFSELLERRQMIDWEGTVRHFSQFRMTLSLN